MKKASGGMGMIFKYTAFIGFFFLSLSGCANKPVNESIRVPSSVRAENFQLELSEAACSEGLKCSKVSLVCDEGSECYFGFSQAKKRCKKEGGRLPTLKELAFWIAREGNGRGLAPASLPAPAYQPVDSTDSQFSGPRRQLEYELWEYKTSAGKSDKFFYSRDGQINGDSQPFWADAVTTCDSGSQCAIHMDRFSAQPSWYYLNGTWARLACVFSQEN